MTIIIATQPRGEVGAGATAVSDPAVLEGYLRDASGRRGYAAALYRPRNEAELAAVVRAARDSGVALTVSAGRTSTTASAVPPGGWIVSMEQMTRILEIDGPAQSARAEPGVWLGDFQRAVDAEGFLYPPDPTSRDECTLGGSVACNASGPRSFVYGATRRWITGLRVVLGCGCVIALERGEVVARAGAAFEIRHCEGQTTHVPVPSYPVPRTSKHAAGYAADTGEGLDLLDLFIGSEGTLGIVSEVTVRLRPAPEQVVALLLLYSSEDAALDLVERARTAGRAGEAVRPCCLEWLDRRSIEIAVAAVEELSTSADAAVAVFAEQECRGDADEDVCLAAWEALVETGDERAPLSVIVARSEGQRDILRRARHAVPTGVNEMATQNGMPKVGTDLALPDAHLRDMVSIYHTAADTPRTWLEPAARQALVAGLRRARGEEAGGEGVDDEAGWRAEGLPERLEAVTFGHVGDNHLHMNLLPKSAAALALAHAVYDQLTDWAVSRGGSPSAEHGIGKIKHGALRRWLGDDGLAEMAAVKAALDPPGLLGRGNLQGEVPPEIAR